MVWQDILIAICTFLFAYSLVPQIIAGYREKKGLVEIQTSLITALGLYLVAAAMFTLHLYFSASMNFLTAILWSVILIQKLIYK